MRMTSRKAAFLVTTAVALAAARAGVPTLLTRLANVGLGKMPGIRGSVRRVQMNFLAPSATLQGISVGLLNAGTPAHRIEVGAITVNSQWKALLMGAVVASVHVDAPHLLFDANGARQNNDIDHKHEQNRGEPTQSWQEKLAQLPRFKVTSATIANGKVSVVGVQREKETELSVDRLTYAWRTSPIAPILPPL
jgi:hypothetical protein